MNDEEKLLWMFKEVHGEMTGSCYTEVECDELGDPVAIRCMKDGNICWSKTKVDLVFDYLTKHLDLDLQYEASRTWLTCQKCFKEEATMQNGEGTYLCSACY